MKEIQSIIEKQRRYFESGETKSVEFRKNQLKKLRKVIQENEFEIMDALRNDLNKAPFEAYETEIGIVLEEISFMLKHVDRLARPKRVKTPLAHFISTSKVYQDPYGIVLIMSPWNYPFQLTIAPLVGAMAAGNCCIIKPSNYSPHTSLVIQRLIKTHFEEQYVAVVEGGREVNQSLLEQRFDLIFFTGSVAVGKVVMAEASKHLTPVVLELGGKSPCIIDQTANVSLAAKRIAWGKYLNAGQTCVAPDYVLIHKEVKKQFLEEIDKHIKALYTVNPFENPDYPKIINEKHFERLQGLLIGENIVVGGAHNRQTCQIEPTVIEGTKWDSAVMQEEIFGPILPVIEFQTLDEVVRQVNSRPKPLALYFFTNSKQNEQFITSHISYGGGCINDTIVHLATSYMAFGGVGESGMGGYHGKESFRTFSHSKSVLKKSNLIDIPLRYPPFKNHLPLLKKILK